MNTLTITAESIRNEADYLRNVAIKHYFTYSGYRFKNAKQYLGQLNPNGEFYRINCSLKEFPSLIASFLKGKKHEWIILGFEKEKRIDLIWANKGFDRSSASLLLPVNIIADIAKTEHYTSVLDFHNHPNINPNYYDYRKPSEQDIKFTSDFGHLLNNQGINLISFICERGDYYPYRPYYADEFLPIDEFTEQIMHKYLESIDKYLLSGRYNTAIHLIQSLLNVKYDEELVSRLRGINQEIEIVKSIKSFFRGLREIKGEYIETRNKLTPQDFEIALQSLRTLIYHFLNIKMPDAPRELKYFMSTLKDDRALNDFFDFTYGCLIYKDLYYLEKYIIQGSGLLDLLISNTNYYQKLFNEKIESVLQLEINDVLSKYKDI